VAQCRAEARLYEKHHDPEFSHRPRRGGPGRGESRLRPPSTYAPRRVILIPRPRERDPCHFAGSAGLAFQPRGPSAVRSGRRVLVISVRGRSVGSPAGRLFEFAFPSPPGRGWTAAGAFTNRRGTGEGTRIRPARLGSAGLAFQPHGPSAVWSGRRTSIISLVARSCVPHRSAVLLQKKPQTSKAEVCAALLSGREVTPRHLGSRRTTQCLRRRRVRA
jgi:hypothetical protein